MKNLKYFAPAAMVLGLLVPVVALANPFYAGTRAASAVATSTQAFLTAGVSTSTAPIYDAYEHDGTNQTNAGNNSLPDSVAVLVNGAASSTSSVVNVSCEYSDNYNALTGNGDWYQNDFLAPTTTSPVGVSAPITYQFAYSVANSAVGGVLLPNSRFQKVVYCPVPLRYLRVVTSVTGANASVWTAVLPTKQRN